MRYVLLWWALLEVLGLISLPLTFRLFSPANAHGYPFAKVFTLLVATYVSWIASHLLGVPFHIALPGTLGLLVLASAWRVIVDREAMSAWLRAGGAGMVLRHNLLWTAGFLFFAWQRSMAPDIFGAEKYMDFAFLNSLLRSDTFPPADPWMSGGSINYYYFGYLAYSNLIRLSGIPSHVAYNLCVATVGGLGFAEFAALGYRLTERWFFAALSGALTMVAGNLDGFLQWLERGSLTPMDYWRSSRVVAKGDTINEFPFFSTIHGDLHPHFMVLPVTGLLFGLLLDRHLFPRRTDDSPAPWLGLGLIGFVLGAMVCISTWELPVGALLVFLMLGRDLPLWPLVSKARLRLAAEVAGILVLAFVLFLPFYLNFQAPAGNGIGAKLARTSLLEFLIVFGQFLFPLVLLAVFEARRLVNTSSEGRHMLMALALLLIFLAAAAGNAVIPLLLLTGAGLLALNYRVDDDSWRAPLNLAIVGLIALLVCEVVFVRDSYGEKLYRMNTVFKLYFQAWLLLALAAPWALATLINREWNWGPAPKVVAALGGLLLVAACAYPVGLTLTRQNSPWPLALDGTAYLEREHPDDFAAIVWLRNNVQGQPVLLEASGDPYSYYARFASNTGLPTVMGWANHEGLWRGHDQIVEARKRDVKQIYAAPTLEAAAPLLDRYAVKYILVGDLERHDFKQGLPKFDELKVAFRQGQTTVYER